MNSSYSGNFSLPNTGDVPQLLFTHLLHIGRFSGGDAFSQLDAWAFVCLCLCVWVCVCEEGFCLWNDSDRKRRKQVSSVQLLKNSEAVWWRFWIGKSVFNITRVVYDKCLNKWLDAQWFCPIGGVLKRKFSSLKCSESQQKCFFAVYFICIQVQKIS